MYVTFWTGYNGYMMYPGDVLDSFELSDFSFSTQFHGGFSSASFKLFLPEDYVDYLYAVLLNAHGQVVDRFGKIVYEGYVNEMTRTGSDLSINMLGYYSHADRYLDDRIYVTSPTTLFDVVQDAIDLIPSWKGITDRAVYNSADYNLMVTDPETGNDLPLDFTDMKIREALERCLGYGWSESYPVPAYLALYENGVVQLIRQFDPSFYETRRGLITIYKHNIVGDIASSLSLNEVRNRIFAVYANAGEGPSKTTAANDVNSQGKYGVIEGLLQNGGNDEGITMANSLRDYALSVSAFPRSEISFSVTGLITRESGWFDNPWMIRAGDVILFADIDLIYTDEPTTLRQESKSKYQVLVTSTSYSQSSNQTSITVGATDSQLEIMMSRLGLSGGIK